MSEEFMKQYKVSLSELLASVLPENKGKNIVVSPYAVFGAPEEIAAVLTKEDGLVISEEGATFDSAWKIHFDPENMWKEDFTNSNGTVSNITFMHGTEKYYLEDKGFTGFSKRYRNGYSLMVLLPKKEGGEALREALINADLGEMFKNRKDENVRSAMPAFEADFAFEKDETAYKACVKVNNEGPSATQFNALMSYTGIMSAFSHNVKINRPFAFAIIHDTTCVPAFVGVINKL